VLVVAVVGVRPVLMLSLRTRVPATSLLIGLGPERLVALVILTTIRLDLIKHMPVAAVAVGRWHSGRRRQDLLVKVLAVPVAVALVVMVMQTILGRL
jgi:hypothetical protein